MKYSLLILPIMIAVCSVSTDSKSPVRLAFGYQAIKLMANIVAGDRSGIPESRQIFISTLVIRQGNVDEFSAKVSKLKE